MIAWLKILIFIIIATFFSNLVVKLSGLLLLNTATDASSAQALTWLLKLLALYVQYKIIAFLFDYFPDNYRDHSILIWFLLLCQPIALKLYLEITFPSLSKSILPEQDLFYGLVSACIVAYFVTVNTERKAIKRDEAIQKAAFIDETKRLEQKLSGLQEPKTFEPLKVYAQSSGERETSSATNSDTSKPEASPYSVSEASKSDDAYYGQALEELENGNEKKDTYAKALTLCKGDKEQAKWSYIELRVEALKRDNTQT